MDYKSPPTNTTVRVPLLRKLKLLHSPLPISSELNNIKACSNLTLRTIFLLLYVDNNFIVDNHLKDINFVEFNIQTEREYFNT